MPRGQIRDLHHANLLVGERGDAEAYFRTFIGSLDFTLANNPDFISFHPETFGVDEARQLKALSSRRALNGHKVFFISSLHITVEAQNALLKTFEDPTPNTSYFLTVRETGVLLPTLLSRMQSVAVPKVGAVEASEVLKFITMPLKDRLIFAKKFVDDELDVVGFLDQLLLALRDKGDSAGLKKLFEVRKIMRSNPPAPRLALEHLSLVL